MLTVKTLDHARYYSILMGILAGYKYVHPPS